MISMWEHFLSFNSSPKGSKFFPLTVALVRASYSGSTLYAQMDPTLVDLKINFIALCINMIVYLYNYSYRVELSMNTHEGKC